MAAHSGAGTPFVSSVRAVLHGTGTQTPLCTPPAPAVVMHPPYPFAGGTARAPVVISGCGGPLLTPAVSAAPATPATPGAPPMVGWSEVSHIHLHQTNLHPTNVAPPARFYSGAALPARACSPLRVCSPLRACSPSGGRSLSPVSMSQQSSVVGACSGGSMTARDVRRLVSHSGAFSVRSPGSAITPYVGGAPVASGVRVATLNDSSPNRSLPLETTVLVSSPVDVGTGGPRYTHIVNGPSSGVQRRISAQSADRSFSPGSPRTLSGSPVASPIHMMQTPVTGDPASALVTAAVATAPWLIRRSGQHGEHGGWREGKAGCGADAQDPLAVPDSPPPPSMKSAKVSDSRNVATGQGLNYGIVLHKRPNEQRNPGRKGSKGSAVEGRRGSTPNSRRNSLGNEPKPWCPAKSIKAPLDVLSRTTGDTLTPRSSTPRSGNSSPRGRREDRFGGLYADAAARKLRLKVRQAEKEREVEKTLEPWYESPEHRARSRSGSMSPRRGAAGSERGAGSRRGSLFDLAEEKTKRLEQMQALAQLEKRLKEERELQECTFKPVTHAGRRYSMSSTSAPDDRCQNEELVQRLRHLAQKQSSIKSRLEHLEREWRLAHGRLEEAFGKRVMELQKERQSQVKSFLMTAEGLEYLKDNEALLASQAGMSPEDARQQVFDELMQDASTHNKRTLWDEMEPQYRQLERDYQAKSRVLVQSLDDIETRARPTLEAVRSRPEGDDLVRNSGFVIGLAAEADEAARNHDADTSGITASPGGAHAESTGGTGAAPSCLQAAGESVTALASGTESACAESSAASMVATAPDANVGESS
eukprot:TRINITY_DN14941_c0_g3_i1.p1 TRINITY_DN14941_c0_g3~~TRINITY_DN14941_c0_g3_i1.p1  ORF type:complete len:832 (-),score=87.79 TRINITY_DN14941_c0_g3_i1:202-2649(-)